MSHTISPMASHNLAFHQEIPALTPYLVMVVLLRGGLTCKHAFGLEALQLLFRAKPKLSFWRNFRNWRNWFRHKCKFPKLAKPPKLGEISETWRNFRNLAKLNISRECFLLVIKFIMDIFFSVQVIWYIQHGT